MNAAAQAFFGPHTKHVSSLAAVSPTFANEVMTHPTYLAACDEILLPQCSRYRLNLGHLIVRGPGAQAQIPHRDEDVWPHFPRPHADIQIASILALVDFRAENGATRVVPGSHRWDRSRRPEPDEIVDAVVPAGGAVIYLGSTIHFAGTNSTADEWRRGLHISYTLGWLRTEENNCSASRRASRGTSARGPGTPRLCGARRDRRRRRLPRHGAHARPDGAPGVGRARLTRNEEGGRQEPDRRLCASSCGAAPELLQHGVRLVVQPYGSTTEFAVPSLNTMAPHDGVGMTWESGYFVGPASPLISNVIVDAAFWTDSGVGFEPAFFSAWMKKSAER